MSVSIAPGAAMLWRFRRNGGEREQRFVESSSSMSNPCDQCDRVAAILLFFEQVIGEGADATVAAPETGARVDPSTVAEIDERLRGPARPAPPSTARPRRATSIP
jgi:hypothetical protein